MAVLPKSCRAVCVGQPCEAGRLPLFPRLEKLNAPKEGKFVRPRDKLFLACYFSFISFSLSEETVETLFLLHEVKDGEVYSPPP